MNTQYSTRFPIFLKNVFLIVIATFFVSCQQAQNDISWSEKELGAFDEIKFKKIPKTLKGKAVSLISDSRIIRMALLSASTDFTPLYSVKSLFHSPRELFYISDILEPVNEVNCRLDADIEDIYPLAIPASDYSRLKEVKMTSKTFADLHFVFTKEAIQYHGKKVSKIPGEKQQKRPYKEIMDQYQKSSRMSLPKTILAFRDTFSLQNLKDYQDEKLTPENVETRFFYFKENAPDTAFNKLPYSKYVAFNEKGRLLEKAEDGDFSIFYVHNSKNQLAEIKQQRRSRKKDGLLVFTQMKYFYSSSALLDSVQNFNHVNRKLSTDIFEYNFQVSKNGFYKLTVNLSHKFPDNKPDSKGNPTEIIFDEKMNWISIKKLNGEINRRISYQES